MLAGMELTDSPAVGAPSGAAGTTDYERVARAIAYLRRHTAAQPDLAAVARHVHLSKFHFQRLFLHWAGVSPKRFLQCLTLEHAKARILESRNLLDIADEVGLSGSGRLHDLFVTLEAMSPGEFRSGGAGLRIRFGFYESPFGPCVIGTTPRGICALRFLEQATERDAAGMLEEEWPRVHLERDQARAVELGQRIFDPVSSQPAKPLAVLVKGTNFQLQVWRALIKVPAGGVTTYGQLAAETGNAGAARAVGSAAGANPIAYLIPCHRVIRESGMLGGYRWGEIRKAAILGWEAARASISGH